VYSEWHALRHSALLQYQTAVDTSGRVGDGHLRLRHHGRLNARVGLALTGFVQDWPARRCWRLDEVRLWQFAGTLHLAETSSGAVGRSCVFGGWPGMGTSCGVCVCVCLGMRGRLLSSASERDDDASGSGIGRGGDWPRSGLVQQPRTGLSPRKHHPRGLRRGPVASEYAVRPVCFAARDIDHCCSAFCALPSRNGTFTPSE
jgi:hypothetical protein